MATITNMWSDFLVEVALGRVAGHSFVHKFGRNADIGTSEETVWDQGGLYSYLASASILKISSSDADDTSAGTGARTIEIFGLDTNHVEINETITLNGQTAVNTVNEYLRIFRGIVRTGGSGGKNAGDIYAGTGTVTAGVPANKFLKVIVGKSQTLMALFTVPANKTALCIQMMFSSGSQKATESMLYIRPENEVFQVKDDFDFFQDNVRSQSLVYSVITPKSDIELRSLVATGTAPISGFFDLLLIDD